MVKLIFLCRRRGDLTHEQYAKRLLHDHVPLALAHHPALQRYVVNIVERSPDGFEPLDSIGELWFDSLADFRERLYDSDDGRRIIEADVRGFMGGADAYATTEHVQKSASTAPALGTRSPGVKLLCPITRRAGLSHADFVAHWLRQHVPLALRHHPGMSAYVTNVVDDQLSSSGESWDGFAELHFSSAEALAQHLFDSPAGERVIRTDMARFIGRTAAYRVAEFIEKP